MYNFKVEVTICTINLVNRTIAPLALGLFDKYPILTITGPRQSGKTTLVKTLFPEKPYVNFEKPDIREFFESDPNGFLSSYPDGAIFDEIQRVPQLSSYLQVLVDDLGRNSLFVLTGSAQFEMLALFQRFIRLCAGRVGQLVNFEALGNDTGVSGVTIRHWLSVLEASYVVFLLPPWYGNSVKRLVKSQKLYFYDTGLAALIRASRAISIFTGTPRAWRSIFYFPTAAGLFPSK